MKRFISSSAATALFCSAGLVSGFKAISAITAPFSQAAFIRSSPESNAATASL
jgi:hypothetical protein